MRRLNESRSCYIHGIGVATPRRALTPDESVALFEPACGSPRALKLLRRIVRLSGIDQRRLAVLDYQIGAENPVYLPISQQPRGPGMGARNGLFEQAATPLVAEAIAGLPAEARAGIDTLVTVSCTHASAPGLERPVFRALPELAPSVDRWNLGFMGCSAALAALRMLHRAAARGPEALVVCCELSSLHFQYTDQIDQMTANLLFADGAAALRLSGRPSRVRLLDARCAALPEYADQMRWFADDNGLRLELSQELPDSLAASLPGEIDAFLGANEITRADIRHWVSHPGGPQILDAVERSLGLPDGSLQLSREVLRAHGNMSSPTILFILRELLNSGASGKVALIAFGPGLAIELALLDISRGEALP